MTFVQNATSQRVTNWFHKNQDFSMAPSVWVFTVAEQFIEHCRNYRLPLCTTDSQFHTTLCEAICVMYHASITNKDWLGPHRIFPIPECWDESKERLWSDYIHGRVFTYEFWDLFWEHVEEGSWEFNIPNFRANIQHLLPLYINRSNDILVEEGALFEQGDGNIVTAEEYENTEDTWFY